MHLNRKTELDRMVATTPAFQPFWGRAPNLTEQSFKALTIEQWVGAMSHFQAVHYRDLRPATPAAELAAYGHIFSGEQRFILGSLHGSEQRRRLFDPFYGTLTLELALSRATHGTDELNEHVMRHVLMTIHEVVENSLVSRKPASVIDVEPHSYSMMLRTHADISMMVQTAYAAWLGGDALRSPRGRAAMDRMRTRFRTETGLQLEEFVRAMCFIALWFLIRASVVAMDYPCGIHLPQSSLLPEANAAIVNSLELVSATLRQLAATAGSAHPDLFESLSEGRFAALDRHPIVRFDDMPGGYWITSPYFVAELALLAPLVLTEHNCRKQDQRADFGDIFEDAVYRLCVVLFGANRVHRLGQPGLADLVVIGKRARILMEVKSSIPSGDWRYRLHSRDELNRRIVEVRQSGKAVAQLANTIRAIRDRSIEGDWGSDGLVDCGVVVLADRVPTTFLAEHVLQQLHWRECGIDDVTAPNPFLTSILDLMDVQLWRQHPLDSILLRKMQAKDDSRLFGLAEFCRRSKLRSIATDKLSLYFMLVDELATSLYGPSNGEQPRGLEMRSRDVLKWE